MSNGPLPSNMRLLSSLPARPVGDKVRFLGCVTSYATASGVLTLEHRHPAGPAVAALVDVRLLLESLNSGQTSIGEWVNVIGYISAASPSAEKIPGKARLARVHVQALVLWSAGPLDIRCYEACLDKMEGGSESLGPAEKDGR